MKKTSLFLLLLIMLTFFLNACSCAKEAVVDTDTAVNILKESKVSENVEITTITEANVNGTKSTSTQTDIYYNNKYYHLTDNNGVSTKTWYGYIDNVLYAFYYTKNAANEEMKSSSRIEDNLLKSANNQPNFIFNTLFDENGKLLSKYDLTASKKKNTYTIQATSNLNEESISYTITIEKNKISKIIKSSNIAKDTIKIIYEYNYDVSDFYLPSLDEYPLS